MTLERRPPHEEPQGSAAAAGGRPVRPLRSRRRRRVEWTLKLALAGFSTLLGLMLGELGLRLAGYRAIHEIYSKPGMFWVHDDLLGWSHEPGAQQTYVGPRPWPIEFRTAVHINSLGLRGPEISARPADGLRLLVLGDSLVASFEVPDEASYVRLLGSRLTQALDRPVEAINAGVRGYGTDQSLLYYRDRGRKLAADLVLLVHTENDPSDNVEVHQMRRPFGKPAFALLDDGSLLLKGVPVPAYPMCSDYDLSAAFEIERRDGVAGRLACRAQMALLDHSALVSFLALRVPWDAKFLRSLYHLGRPAAAAPAPAEHPEREPAGRLTHALILALAGEVRTDGAAFRLVLSDTSTLDFGTLRAAGIDWIDLAPIEGATHQEIRFQNDSHFNVLGHRRVADLLTPILADELRRIKPASPDVPAESHGSVAPDRGPRPRGRANAAAGG